MGGRWQAVSSQGASTQSAGAKEHRDREWERGGQHGSGVSAKAAASPRQRCRHVCKERPSLFFTFSRLDVRAREVRCKPHIKGEKEEEEGGAARCPPPPSRQGQLNSYLRRKHAADGRHGQRGRPEGLGAEGCWSLRALGEGQGCAPGRGAFCQERGGGKHEENATHAQNSEGHQTFFNLNKTYR